LLGIVTYITDNTLTLAHSLGKRTACCASPWSVQEQGTLLVVGQGLARFPAMVGRHA